MALSENQTPGSFQLSLNPVWSQLTTNNYVVTAGVKAALEINLAATGATAGQTITLPFNGKTIVLTFAAALDGSGKKLRVAGALTLSQFVAQLAQDIAKNYYIADTFDITTASGKVILTAKETGEDQSFIAPATTATDVTIGTNTAGVDEVVQENFKVVADVYMEKTYKSGVYEKIHGQEETPDINSQVLFDFHDALHSQIGQNNDLPSYNQTTITRCDNILRRYKYRYAEKYGTDPEYKEVAESDVLYVLKGGLSFKEAAIDVSFIDGWLMSQQKFNTFQPRTKTIIKSQQEYLYFMVPSAMTTIKIKAELYYTDGTTEIKTPKTKTSVTGYEMYILPVGYDQIIVPSTGKTVYKYKIWVVDQSDVVKSETFTYTLTDKPTVDTHIFLFENGQSGFDTLRCTGTNTAAISVKSDVAERITSFSYDPVNGAYEKYASKGTNPFKQTTGWKTKAEIDYLEELFYSKNVFECVDGEFVPVIITTQGAQKYDSRTNMYAFMFEYYYAFNNVASKGIVTDSGGGGA